MSLICQLTSEDIKQHFSRLAGWLAGWLSSGWLLSGWLAVILLTGCLSCWLAVVWLTCYLADWLPVLLTGCLSCWLAGWLAVVCDQRLALRTAQGPVVKWGLL